MRLIDADAMVQRLEERLEELDKEGVHIAEDSNGFFDILIDHLMLGSEIRTLREWINKQPTIKVTSTRYGRWIKMSDADGIFYACSNCGEWHKETSNYCSNCGAQTEYVRKPLARALYIEEQE